MNSFYIPKSAIEYIQNDFKGQFEIIKLDHSEDTIKVQFDRNIDEIDLTYIFFAGAKWGLNYINKIN